MVNKEAFLFGDMVELDKDVILNLVNDFMAEFFEYKSEEKIEFPTIIKGSFSGYVNRDGWPIGTFHAYDGRVFIAEVEQVTELTPNYQRYNNGLYLVSFN